MSTDLPVCETCGAVLDLKAPGGLCRRCLLAQAMQPTESLAGAERQPPPFIGTVQAAFPHLEILEFVGQGGMGWVFKARQPKLNRAVALKLLPSSFAERDAAFAGRFEREGQLLARLHHPNIVTVYDSGVAGGFYYLLMEYVEGVNLRQAMRLSSFTPVQALAIVPRICDALQFAHDEGVLHRDIKPENILLDTKGRVKLADFGIAKLIGVGADVGAEESAAADVDGHLTQAGTTLGTPNYMAPEQRETPADVDHRADIYSLGVVFYELLTGELPGGTFAAPSTKSDTDPRVDAIVQQALEKERTRRQSSAGEMKTQVETVAGRSAPNSLPSSPRFSRAAIAGFLWPVAGVFALASYIAIGELRTGAEVTDRATPFAKYLLSTQTSAGLVAVIIGLLLIVVTAPFGATVLGWIAITQIRSSAGKVHGLWLAVFDGLAFPLLALDVTLALLWALFCKLVVNFHSGPEYATNPQFHSLVTIAMGLAPLLGIIVVDFFITRFVWRAVNRSPGSPKPATAPARPNARQNLVVAVWVLIFLSIAGLAVSFSLLKTSKSGSPAGAVGSDAPADSPSFLRKLSTAEVIQVGISKPISPWAWQELDRRPLTAADAQQIMDGLLSWLKREHPTGFTEPLNWLNTFLDHLQQRGLVNDEQAVRFVQALEGEIRGAPLLRVREGSPNLDLRAEWRNKWLPSLLGLALMNQVSAVAVDDRFNFQDAEHSPALPANSGKLRPEFNYWNASELFTSLPLSLLSPGEHIVRLEVTSALVSVGDLTGLGPNAPSNEWPPAKKRWTRSTTIKLVVYPRDAVIVGQTHDPALIPSTPGALGIKQAIVRSKGAQSQALLVFNVGPKLPVAISFDVTLRAGAQSVPCGALWAGKDWNSDSPIGTRGGGQLTAALSPLPPDIKEADIVLTPNPKYIEHVGSVDQIWGEPIVLKHVPLMRQDREARGLPGQTLSFGPVIERVIAIGNASQSFYSLDKEDYVPGPPAPAPEEFHGLDWQNEGQRIGKWLTDHDVDFLAVRKDGKPTLIFSDMVCSPPCTESEFERWTPQELMQSDKFKQELARQSRPPFQPTWSGSAEKIVEAFQTRYERLGMVQVVGITNDPPGVKIRYKLAQQASNESSAALRSDSDHPSDSESGFIARLPHGSIKLLALTQYPTPNPIVWTPDGQACKGKSPWEGTEVSCGMPVEGANVAEEIAWLVTGDGDPSEPIIRFAENSGVNCPYHSVHWEDQVRTKQIFKAEISFPSLAKEADLQIGVGPRRMGESF